MSPLATAPALEELLPPLLPPPPPQPDRGAPLLHPFIFFFNLIFRSDANFCPFSQCPSALILSKKSELHPNTLIVHSQPSLSFTCCSVGSRASTEEEPRGAAHSALERARATFQAPSGHPCHPQAVLSNF